MFWREVNHVSSSAEEEIDYDAIPRTLNEAVGNLSTASSSDAVNTQKQALGKRFEVA